MNRDTEYIFGYPAVQEKIGPEEIWAGNPGPRNIVLYIHIPFCKSICKFCPFTKYPWQPPLVEQYLGALKKEIAMIAAKPAMQDAHIEAVFFGGGSPSCLSGEQLNDILGYCFQQFRIDTRAEITAEANPDIIAGAKDVGSEKLDAFLRAGVNRISFGVQSFDNQVLHLLGCNHTGAQAAEALRLAFNAGFTNVGLDLLYRIPGQTLFQWLEQLQYAVNLNASHITIPELSIDPRTRFYEELQQGKIPPQPGEEQTIAMYEKGCELLAGSSYRHYNLGYDFALAEKECLYHRANWEAPQKETLGIGAGAYSYINGTTYFNIAPLTDYIQCVLAGSLPTAAGKRLTKNEMMARYMVHGVYFIRVNKKSFSEQFGVSLDQVYGDVIRKLAELGWLIDNPGEIILTSKGKLYINNISKAFYEVL